MNDEKKYNIIITLHSQTTNGLILWDETANPDIFQSRLGEYIVQIRKYQDDSGQPEYALDIINNDGDILDEINDPMFGPELFQTFAELYSAARGYARGTEQALDSILEHLRSNEPPF